MKKTLEDRFWEDFYFIIYSEDVEEAFHLSILGYTIDNRETFLKFLREEYSTEKLNIHFKSLQNGVPEMTISKMEELESKFEVLQKIRLKIPEFQLKLDDKKLEAISIPFPSKIKDEIISKIHDSLNTICFEEKLEDFKKHFYFESCSKIQWLVEVGKLKGFFDKGFDEGIFTFSNINEELALHFIDKNGKDLTAKQISHRSPSCYKQIDMKDKKTTNPFVLLIRELKFIATSPVVS